MVPTPVMGCTRGGRGRFSHSSLVQGVLTCIGRPATFFPGWNAGWSWSNKQGASCLHAVASQVQLVSKLHILSQISPTLNAAAPVAIQDFSIWAWRLARIGRNCLWSSGCFIQRNHCLMFPLRAVSDCFRLAGVFTDSDSALKLNPTCKESIRALKTAIERKDWFWSHCCRALSSVFCWHGCNLMQPEMECHAFEVSV
jgi:hypothetical protein